MQTSRTSQIRLSSLSFARRLQAAFTGKVARAVAATALAAGSLPLMQMAQPALAAGNITGTVFQDFNSNGTQDTAGTLGTAVDKGVAGITVNAYDAGGNLQGTTTSSASGAYTLTATGTGPYRIEFSTLPTGFAPSARGSGNGTSVQFVADGNTSNVNFAINKPAEFCQNNPTLCTSSYVFGDQVNGANNATSVMVSFPYNGTGSPYGATRTPAPGSLATAQQVGTTFGLAYQRTNKTLFTSSFYKLYAGFGPGGPGAVYKIPITAGAPSVLVSIPNAGTDTHTSGTTNTGPGNNNPGTWLNEYANWDSVGKSSLGGMALSDDGALGSVLFVVNLNDRHLYSVDVNAATPAATDRGAIPSPCANAADARPFGLGYKDGVLFVGGVCSAQSTNNAANLSAYIYTFNGSFSGAPVFSFSLAAASYPHGAPGNFCGPGGTGNWNAWTATNQFTNGTSGTHCAYPQPMLSDIAFDGTDLILGIRDRFGDQAGQDIPGAAGVGAAAGQGEGVSAGDIIRACGTTGTSWTLESNGSCGGAAGAGVADGQGPGNGEFYQDTFSSSTVNNINHNEISSGGVAQVPGFTTAAFTSMNPATEAGNGGDWRAGGVRFNRNANGAGANFYEVYDKCDSAGQNRLFSNCPAEGGRFGKVSGMGDVIALCDDAPIEIGNRLWLDTNANGIQDPGEAALQNVIVSLQTPTGTLTTQTDANGNYYFGNLVPNTAYSITVVPGQAALNGAQLTQANANGLNTNNAVADVRDSDAALVGGTPTIYYTTGTAGQNNHGLDIGFVTPVSLGNYVWFDTNNNGGVDAGEQPVTNPVAVQLYQDTNNDGVFSIGDTLISSTTTVGGLYNFSNLAPTSGSGTGYLVVLPASNFQSGGALFNYQNSSSTVAGNSDVNDQDHGNVIGALGGAGSTGVVASSVITLTAGGEPAAGVDGTDANGNQTIDFGFYQPASLGNYVWVDTNHDGEQNDGNTGVSGVLVTLYDVNGIAITTTNTDAGGFYSFTNLVPGTYSVGFTAPPGYTYTVQGSNPASDTDSNVGPSGRTAPVVLASGENNPTLDAGVWLPAPAISLKKYVNGDDAQTAPGINLTVGSAVTWTFIVSNTGNAPLINVALTDDKLGAITCPKTTLAIGEGMTCTATGIAIAGQYTNIGTVTAKDATNPNGPTLTATDPANYFGAALLASLGNYVWVDANRDGQQGSTSAEPPLAGVTVTLYNIGGTAIATTTTDANGFYSFTNLVPGTYSVGFTLPPGYVVTQQGTTPGSDTDSNVNPATGRTEPVTLVGGENNPTIDAGVYLNAPGISLKKFVNGNDAQTAPGIVVPVGSVVTWTYVVKNIGNVALSNIALTDNKEGAITCPKTALAVNEEMTCTKTGIAKAGQYTNVGTVTGKDATNPNGPTLTSADPANYVGGTPQLVFRKRSLPDELTNGVQTAVNVGDRITYTLQVTNTGNYTATNVRISDGIPPGTQFVVGSAVPAQSSGPSPLVWNLGNLAPSATVSVSFVVTVVNRDPRAVENTAGVVSNEVVTTTASNTVVHTFKPTAVELISFSVSGQRVQWTTGAELNTFGFALYRSSTGNRSDAVLASAEMIAAKGNNTSYEFVDTTTDAGTAYSYWLAEVDTTGATVEYGPVKTEVTGAVIINSQLSIANSVAAGGVVVPVKVDGATAGVAAPASGVTANTSPAQVAQGVSSVNVEAVSANKNSEPTQPIAFVPARQPAAIVATANEPVAANAAAPVAPVQTELRDGPQTAESASPDAAQDTQDTTQPVVQRAAVVVAQPKAALHNAVVQRSATAAIAQAVLLAAVLAGAVALIGGLGLGALWVARRKRN